LQLKFLLVILVVNWNNERDNYYVFHDLNVGGRYGNLGCLR